MAHRILVVDDEKHIVRMIKVNLERNGFIVVDAYDGKEALEKIRSDKPELVILDIMLPYLDGLEVLKAIRQEPETENLPVIILSARARDDDVFNGYRCGATMYLTKPFYLNDIGPMIIKILSAPEAGKQ